MVCSGSGMPLEECPASFGWGRSALLACAHFLGEEGSNTPPCQNGRIAVDTQHSCGIGMILATYSQLAPRYTKLDIHSLVDIHFFPLPYHLRDIIVLCYVRTSVL